jgi:hypothetical protein
MSITGFVNADHVSVVRTTEAADLEQIRLPQVQAVVWMPAQLPAWCDVLAAAVQDGSFEVPRAIIDDATLTDVGGWLEARLPTGVVAPEVREALERDVLALVDRQRALTGASRFMVRALTAAPNQQCGYHVDTVAPGAPTCGLLRVYNGAGTAYVDPTNVVGMREVYHYMSRRERLVRQLADAEAGGDHDASGRLRLGIAELDEARAFLRDPGEVATAPAGSIVAFKHLDVRLHWSDHDPGMAWIHCSPMNGKRRLVVNVTARAPSARRVARPAPGASAP